MPIVADAAVAIRGDLSKFTQDLKKADGPVKSLGDRIKGAFSPANVIGAAGGLFAGAQVVGFLNNTAQAASDLEESTNKARVVFGEAAGAVFDFGERSAEAFGMSRQAALEASGTFGNLLNSLGVGSGRAAEMSVRLVELAADLASFNNMDVRDVLDRLRSGLLGEQEAVERLGISLSEAGLKQRALNMGLVDSTTGVLPPAIRSQAAYAEILEQTALAQGDFARTSDGLANSQRRMAAKIANAEAEIGKAWASIQLGAIKTVEFLNTEVDLWPFDGPKLATEAGITAQATRDSYANTMYGGGAGATVVATAANATIRDPVIDAMLGGKEEAERIAGETPGGIAQALLDNQFSVEDAMAELARVAEESIHPLIERMNIIGFLGSADLAEGLNSSDPAIRAASLAMQLAAESRLAELDGITWGQNFSNDFAWGIVNRLGVVRDASRQLSRAAAGSATIESEPPDHGSALYGHMKWGGNYVRDIADGMLNELGSVYGASSALAGAMVPSFGGSFGYAGAAGGGGGSVTNLNLIVDGVPKSMGSMNEMWSGFEQLGRFGEPGR